LLRGLGVQHALGGRRRQVERRGERCGERPARTVTRAASAANAAWSPPPCVSSVASRFSLWRILAAADAASPVEAVEALEALASELGIALGAEAVSFLIAGADPVRAMDPLT
jgi:hypothetical protein